MAHCKCEFCKLYRRMERTIKSGSHRQKSDLIRELMNMWCMADAELDIQQAINSGDWPTAPDILERRLKLAKSKAATVAA